jgi:Spy/CpxP family protein refolding chaperone
MVALTAALLAVSVGLAAGSRMPSQGAQGQSPPAQGQGRGAPQPGRPEGSRNPCQNPVQARCEWWKAEAVQKELGLTPRQVQRIDYWYMARLKAEKPYAEEIERERDNWDRMLKERTASVTAYTIQVNRVESLRSKMAETRYVMLYRMYLELTPEQHAKLQAMFERESRGGRGGGSPKH